MADRARDPEALEREIERTRQELARTIDALADRVSPRNVAQRGAERIKEEAGQVAKVARAMLAPPDGGRTGERGGDRRALLIGIGVAVTITAFVVWRRRRR
ncbi:hypothetical protein Arub01_18090 [Actinomadura rubrobrunea]|uniref:DUF3618 domain-containing protein n=1 Tax=Actinomadura rubrobrunea TaxID=115335 RepID=A0A9W6PS99_9ACTN|nr:DUF3618 domain-containing protein [Actinomadura rubrobrunea]MBX6769438.1 DUF3618 domain-containing protein [Actinomadura rubrobrunea]GLW63565.1 hypothetical protein Arub01_18090 [Actinomadura rubrobrunea]